jgi:hypothetical protein
MIDSDERQTVIMFKPLKNSARVFKNKVAEEYKEIEKQKGKDF